jgi:hypothetical protein
MRAGVRFESNVCLALILKLTSPSICATRSPTCIFTGVCDVDATCTEEGHMDA